MRLSWSNGFASSKFTELDRPLLLEESDNDDDDVEVLHTLFNLPLPGASGPRGPSV